MRPDDCKEADMCERSECRHHVRCPEIDNCTLEVRRQYTMQEVAEAMGVSRQRVEQLQTKALMAAEREIIRQVDPIIYKSRKKYDPHRR